jgi:hypothetical protein
LKWDNPGFFGTYTSVFSALTIHGMILQVAKCATCNLENRQRFLEGPNPQKQRWLKTD